MREKLHLKEVLNLDLKSNFARRLATLSQGGQEILQKQGLTPHVESLAGFLGEFSPTLGQKLMDFSGRAFRPLVRALGLRISHLSNTHVEIVLPGGRGRAEEMLTAASYAVETLWYRFSLSGQFELHFSKFEAEILAVSNDDLRVRFELSEHEREQALAELSRQRQVPIEGVVKLLDTVDKCVAEVHFEGRIDWVPSLK